MKMFVYSPSIKIHASGFSELLESIFCILLVMEAFSLQTVEILEVVVGWQEVRWMWWMRHNFVAQFVPLLKSWIRDGAISGAVEKNWAHSVHQCWLQVLQFSVHLDLLSILLRCNGFARIQKAAVRLAADHQMVTKDFFFLVQVWLWKVLWSCFLVQPLSWSSLVVV